MITSSVRSSLFVVSKVHVIVDWKQNILGIFQSWLPTPTWITSSFDNWLVILSLMIPIGFQLRKREYYLVLYDSERNVFGSWVKQDIWGHHWASETQTYF